MYYYFDESGNWSDGENHRLVIGAIVGKNKTFQESLSREFKILQAEYGLNTLHASETNSSIRLSILRIISEILEQTDSRALIRIYPNKIVNSRSKKDREEIYADCAADLATKVAFGDDRITIHYDLKFHYAYPANVLEHLNKAKPFYMKKSIQRLEIADRYLLEVKREILNKLRPLEKKRMTAHQRKKLSDALGILEGSMRKIELLDHRSLEKEREKVRRFLSEYLWTEMNLQIEGKDRVQGRFEQLIATKMDEMGGRLGIENFHAMKPRVLFLHKNADHPAVPGIVAIDFLCNLVFKYGIKAPPKAESIEKELYSKIIVEEANDEM